MPSNLLFLIIEISWTLAAGPIVLFLFFRLVVWKVSLVLQNSYLGKFLIKCYISFQGQECLFWAEKRRKKKTRVFDRGHVEVWKLGQLTWKINPLNVKKNWWRSDNLYLIGKRRKRLYQTFELYTTKQRHPYKLYHRNWETADSIGPNSCCKEVSQFL